MKMKVGIHTFNNVDILLRLNQNSGNGGSLTKLYLANNPTLGEEFLAKLRTYSWEGKSGF